MNSQVLYYNLGSLSQAKVAGSIRSLRWCLAVSWR